MKYKIIGFIIIFIIVIVVALYYQRLNYYKKTGANGVSPTPVATLSPRASVSVLPSPTPETSPGISPSPSATPRTEKTLTIEVDEKEAGLYESKAKKGTLVHFTITVVPESVALELKSGDLTTGPINPGDSKTIQFILNETMVFTPSEVKTGKACPYTIKITAFE